jgi:putative molybdopterin biosynthesis protein
LHCDAAAARVFGLDFLPLVSERFDLVIPKQHEGLATTQILLETLNRAPFQRELEMLGGYDTSQTGNLLT